MSDTTICIGSNNFEGMRAAVGLAQLARVNGRRSGLKIRGGPTSAAGFIGPNEPWLGLPGSAIDTGA